MAILKSSHLQPGHLQPGHLRRLQPRRAIVLLLLAAAGCGLAVFGGPAAPLAFSHRVHNEAGLDCSDCHGTVTTAEQPGMPVLAQCMLCHTDIDANKPAERHVDTLFDAQGYRAARVAHLGGDVQFSHLAHAGRTQQCNECHRGIEHSDRIDDSVAVAMADCRTCHEQKAAGNECATCHSEIRADRRPPSHALAWQERHGRVARAHASGAANDCTLCHQQSTCAQCHFDTPPQNHNEYFRLRGHGLMARMDRQNCAACHRSDSCDSCHSTAEPVSHASATWGGTRNNHCVSCHTLSRNDDCATCHRSTPSHAQATAMPSWHSSGMNCRQCHGLSQPLAHVDTGGVCIECHR